ncbi:PLP-dependent aminotransferase family protein [Wukongibacter baidiensis]|uniref:aminotransferase-like domain-containing protein n=1 Tax=Wukongibacter baidiensis TaxID=1723361 RepID=UPI003D7F6729
MVYKFAKRADKIKASEIREILKVTERPEVISFAGGLPAPELFPIEEMKEICQSILGEDGKLALQYSTTEGYKPLRMQISQKMAKIGIDTTMEDIIITSGSQQGLDLTGKVFIDEGDTIICESPTYLAAINAFKTYSPKFLEIKMDDDGMDMEELEKSLKTNKNVKLIYTIPDFQNPTGRTMSLERRTRLIELANEYDVIVIEDNPYGELRFIGEKLPSLKSFDTEGRVIYMSTVSKILSPGLRVGWVCAPQKIIQKYTLLKQGTDLHTNTFSQMQVSKYIEMYDLESHINKIKAVYKNRCNLMIEAIKNEFPDGIKYTHPEGGLFIWVELPSQINSREVLDRCLDNDVAFVPGGSFFPNGGNENTLRLNYSNMTEERIEEGIIRIAKVLREVLK